MPRISHSTLLKAYQKTPLLPLVLRGSRTLPSAINELRWLVEHVQETTYQKSPKIQQQKLLHLCKRRSKGEPLQYILGSQPFGELDIKCRTGVLIPRPETEAYTTYLADLITSGRLEGVLSGRFCPGEDPLQVRPARKILPLKILDLCTGSGCIPLLLNSLLRKSVGHLQIYGWDISKNAVALAIENLSHNAELGHVVTGGHKRIGFGLVNIFDHNNKLKDTLIMQSEQKDESADVEIIISNPPYISREAFRTETTRSVRNWEPKLALVPAEQPRLKGTPMGVDAADVFYQRLIVLHSDVFRSLILVMEVGDEAQALRVAKMAMDHCTYPNIHNIKPNHVEIWKDSPDRDECEVFTVGGDKILVRGSGQARAVVLFKFGRLKERAMSRLAHQDTEKERKSSNAERRKGFTAKIWHEPMSNRNVRT